MGKTFGIALVFVMVGAMFGCSPGIGNTTATDEVVTFPDPNLQAAVRDATNKLAGPIYQSNLDGLTFLGAGSSNIANLSGLEHCTSLTDLYLWDNQISDISPLSNLTSLTYLYLWENQISDISPLSNLTSLTYLYLGQNQISDIKPLVDNSELADGDQVDLRNNPLSATSLNTYIPQLEARGVIVFMT